MFNLWKQIHTEREWGKYPPEHIIRFVAANFGGALDRTKIHILDVGAGQGAVTWYLHREGFSVSAIDCEEAINRLHQRLDNSNVLVEPKLRIESATRMSWKNDHFDACIDNFCLCSITKPNDFAAVKEISRVLKSKGLFFSALFTEKCCEIDGIGLVNYHTIEQIKDLYNPFFKIVEINNLSWTVKNGSKRLDCWLVSCKKT